MSPMTCPLCGRTMTPGELESTRAIVWYPSKPTQPSLRRMLSWEGIKELCAPLTGNVLIPRRGRWENAQSRLPAEYCPDCDRFIIIGRLPKEG